MSQKVGFCPPPDISGGRVKRMHSFIPLGEGVCTDISDRADTKERIRRGKQKSYQYR